MCFETSRRTVMCQLAAAQSGHSARVGSSCQLRLRQREGSNVVPEPLKGSNQKPSGVGSFDYLCGSALILPPSGTASGGTSLQPSCIMRQRETRAVGQIAFAAAVWTLSIPVVSACDSPGCEDYNGFSPHIRTIIIAAGG
ncbi:hypothetical protein EV363DRAFT_1292116 [Boletus edulis]|nr:hypothetical protein EV363DRAFT_1292116 [Boletus edulis]